MFGLIWPVFLAWSGLCVWPDLARSCYLVWPMILSWFGPYVVAWFRLCFWPDLAHVFGHIWPVVVAWFGTCVVVWFRPCFWPDLAEDQSGVVSATLLAYLACFVSAVRGFFPLRCVLLWQDFLLIKRVFFLNVWSATCISYYNSVNTNHLFKLNGFDMTPCFCFRRSSF